MRWGWLKGGGGGGAFVHADNAHLHLPIFYLEMFLHALIFVVLCWICIWCFVSPWDWAIPYISNVCACVPWSATPLNVCALMRVCVCTSLKLLNLFWNCVLVSVSLKQTTGPLYFCCSFFAVMISASAHLCMQKLVVVFIHLRKRYLKNNSLHSNCKHFYSDLLI